LTVSWLPDATEAGPTLAFAISKRVGNAVVRNRLRRRLRESARHMALPAGTYFIRANPAAAAMSFQDLSAHLSRALARLTPAGQAAPQNPVTSDLERPTLEGP
jgi:ribonuclease P protein component